MIIFLYLFLFAFIFAVPTESDSPPNAGGVANHNLEETATSPLKKDNGNDIKQLLETKRKSSPDSLGVQKGRSFEQVLQRHSQLDEEVKKLKAELHLLESSIENEKHANLVNNEKVVNSLKETNHEKTVTGAHSSGGSLGSRDALEDIKDKLGILTKEEENYIQYLVDNIMTDEERNVYFNTFRELDSIDDKVMKTVLDRYKGEGQFKYNWRTGNMISYPKKPRKRAASKNWEYYLKMLEAESESPSTAPSDSKNVENAPKPVPPASRKRRNQNQATKLDEVMRSDNPGHSQFETDWNHQDTITTSKDWDYLKQVLEDEREAPSIALSNSKKVKNALGPAPKKQQNQNPAKLAKKLSANDEIMRSDNLGRSQFEFDWNHQNFIAPGAGVPPQNFKIIHETGVLPQKFGNNHETRVFPQNFGNIPVTGVPLQNVRNTPLAGQNFRNTPLAGQNFRNTPVTGQNFKNTPVTGVPPQNFGNIPGTKVPPQNFGNTPVTGVPPQNFGNIPGTKVPPQNFGNTPVTEVPPQNLKSIHEAGDPIQNSMSKEDADFIKQLLEDSASNEDWEHYLQPVETVHETHSSDPHNLQHTLGDQFAVSNHGQIKNAGGIGKISPVSVTEALNRDISTNKKIDILLKLPRLL